MIKIENKSYMDIKEFALHRRVTVQTVYNWIKHKEVKTKLIFGRKLIEL